VGGIIHQVKLLAYHWYAKNVGKVKQIYHGKTVELVSAVVNSRNSSKTASASSLESSLQLPSVSQKIVEGIKKII